MKTHHPKLKTPPRPLFSCGFFRHCTQTVHSPTTPSNPTLPPPESDPPPAQPPALLLSDQSPPPPQSESGSSSSSTSQSFTQWRFPLPKSPVLHHPPPDFDPPRESSSDPPQETTRTFEPPPPVLTNVAELFHVAELQLSTGSDAARLSALYLLERSLVPNPPADGGPEPACPPSVMGEVVRFLKEPAGAKSSTKVLLALCLSEGNRHVAVEAGAVAEVVEAMAELEGAAAERALAALELLCMVPEGAAELRAHALAIPILVEMMVKMAGRGKEYAISVLAVIFSGAGGELAAPPEEVARAVMLALQGDCSARGRRKGAQLLKVLHENGQLDLTEEGEDMGSSYYGEPNLGNGRSGSSRKGKKINSDKPKQPQRGLGVAQLEKIRIHNQMGGGFQRANNIYISTIIFSSFTISTIGIYWFSPQHHETESVSTTWFRWAWEKWKQQTSDMVVSNLQLGFVAKEEQERLVQFKGIEQSEL
ncbi:hypothetical protein HHK36_006203 [Tetracentron sinense]|uniref:U-box domain-containing protein n=1 Tax=Tetracentron sinense TaxID=13715 RepID=A0A834ZL43_TETSI|nr:hypothetical protein HHK36_006203 [Tetracentron sinense]